MEASIAATVPPLLDTVSWGPGITDIRNFSKLHFRAAVAGEVADYGTFTQTQAEAALKATIAAAPPGVIFSSNPHYSIYAKWDNLLVKAGFKHVSNLCAINRVYRKTWDWKGKSLATGNPYKAPAWESQDGFNHWIHAMYLVKEPVPAKLSFDWKNFNGNNGDTDRYKMWGVSYGARTKHPDVGNGKALFEPAFARLAHNCGCAMGEGLPKYGKYVDEEFYTIAAIPEDTLFPKGYTRFLVAGGLKFGHNLKKLLGDTAQECPHKFDVL